MKKKSQFGIGRSPDSFNYFKNHELDWNFKIVLGFMNEKAAEIGECLFVASKINESDGESWIREWAKLASKVEKQAEKCLAGGHEVSAREAFLRASNYYHAAERGCTPSHLRFHELWKRGVDCMHKACTLFNPPVQVIEVPFEGKKLPGYFWHPDNASTKHPTLFAVGGNDSSIEQVFFMCGPAAMRRGYNFFTFDFPGHRGAVHLHPDCVKRPDMEVPFKAALNYVESLPGVDDRIALTGFSFGGYVVSRVAIHENRVSAVIPSSPLVDVYRSQTAMLKTALEKIPTWLIEMLVSFKVNRSPLMKSMLELAMWNSGYDDWSIRNMIKELKGASYAADYSICNDLHKITCAALALVSEDEGEELVKQAHEFYEGISSKEKKIHVFSLEKDGSNDHCQLDNRTKGNQIMFDWLDEIFNYNPML